MSFETEICGRGIQNLDFQSHPLQETHLTHPYTLSATLELTHRCSLKCPHCFIAPKSFSNELTTGEITDVFDQLADMGVLLLTLTGGDPAIRRDIIEVVQAAVERRFVVSLKTSAVDLKENDIRKLSHWGLYRLNVSLYHTDAAQHDHFVGQIGAWEKTIAALRAFKKEGGRVLVSVIIMNWNLDNILQLEELIDREQWEYVMDFRIEARLDGDRRPTSFQTTGKGLAELIAKSNFFCKSAVKGNALKSTADTILCGAEKGLVIRPNGDVVPCVSLPDFRLGNIREQPLVDIWNQSKEKRKKLSIRLGEHRPCVSCDLAADCARCLASAVREHGDITKPSSIDCQMAEVRHQARLERERNGR